FADDEWDRVLEAIAARLGHAAALLDGELPPEIADDAAGAGLDLLPGGGEVGPRCDCPDDADPCKHSAAACYLIADALDADPFALFLLRGRTRHQGPAGIRARASGGSAAVAPRPPRGSGRAGGGCRLPGVGAGVRAVGRCRADPRPRCRPDPAGRPDAGHADVRGARGAVRCAPA